MSKSHSSLCVKDDKLSETKCDERANKTDQVISLENCDVLKNYKIILDNHSKRCETEEVSPVSPEEEENVIITRETRECSNDDNNNKNAAYTSSSHNVTTPPPPSSKQVEKTSTKSNKISSDTLENPNYYNKYFKKDGGSRIRGKDDKRTGKGRVDDKARFDERQRFYESTRRYNSRADFNEGGRERRDDRRFFKEYRDYQNKDSSQYYFERKDERRYDSYSGYSSNQYFTNPKQQPETNMSKMNYNDVNANGSGGGGSVGASTVFQTCSQTKPTPPQFSSQICDPSSVTANPDLNGIQYQYGYYNNYVYPNSGYRFYGNVPFINMSLIQQQPMPPGTGDSVGNSDAPPLPLEPPPDLPPPPETPPPPPK